MRILTVKLPVIYEWENDSEETKEKKRAQMEARRDRLRKVGIIITDQQDMSAPVVAMKDSQYIDLLALREETGEVVSIVEVGSTVESAAEKISVLAGKIEAFADKVGNAQFNEKVEVYTPGAGLMLFNRVTLLQDACSDSL